MLQARVVSGFLDLLQLGSLSMSVVCGGPCTHVDISGLYSPQGSY